MKPTKKKPAKRKVVSAKDFAKRNPVLSKLLDLKYRINEAYRNGGSSFKKGTATMRADQASITAPRASTTKKQWDRVREALWTLAQ